MRPSKLRAVGLAAAMVGWSFAAPRVRWHPIPNASLGTGLVAATGSPLGLRPPALWSGIRYGCAAGAAAALGVFAISTLPPVRRAMAVRELPEHPARWLLLSIPIGTVWPEEAAYRATLGTVLLTGIGGWLFGWLHARSGSLAAPMLAHLAVNEAGGLAALAVQRRARRLGSCPRTKGAPSD